MKDKTKIITLLLVFFAIFPLFSQTKETTPPNKQEALLNKDKANRERILARYDEFYQKIKTRHPGLNFQELPVDPGLARDVIEHNDAPGQNSGKAKQIFAYSSENYFLKSEPSALPQWNTTTKLSRGEKIEVVLVFKKEGKEKKEESNWCLVRKNNGKEGYIPSEFLSNQTVSKEDSLEKRLSSTKPVKTRNFSFPTQSKNTKKTKNLERPFFHSETGEMTEWTTIPGKKPEEGVSMTQETFKGKSFWVSASSLNVRENPDINSYVIDRLAKASRLTVLLSTKYEDTIDGITSYWHQIESNGNKGWVFGGYLSSTEIMVTENSTNSDFPSFPSENPEDLKPGEKRYVRSALLRLRDEPNEYGTVVTSIPGDSKLKILDVKNEIETIGGISSKWIYIDWDGNWEGWIFGGFVSKEKGQLVDNDDISKYFQIPIDNNRYVSSGFGTRIDPVTGKAGVFHMGVDLPAPIGTPIRAVSDGKVWKTITTSGGYGVLTILSHKNNIYTYYAHQSERKVTEGDSVRSGEVIGEVGNTGKSTGPHLHFEVRKGPAQQALDPETYLPK